MIQFAVFVFCLFLTYAFYLLLSRKTEARKARLEKRISEALLYSANTRDAEVNLARQELLSEIPWVDSFLIKLQSASQLKRFIDQSDLDMTVMRLLLFSGLAGFLAMMAVSIVSTSKIFMIFAGVLCAALPFVHVSWK